MLIRNVESGQALCSTVVGLDNGEIRDSAVAVVVACRVVGARVVVCRDLPGTRLCLAWARPVLR